jgi:AcrR family transcriptional regulator
MPEKTRLRPGGDERRESLVRAAFTCLAAYGFEGLRTRSAADRAGVNIATLHYYFPTKEALIGGVADYLASQFITLHAPPVAATGKAGARPAAPGIRRRAFLQHRAPGAQRGAVRATAAGATRSRDPPDHRAAVRTLAVRDRALSCCGHRGRRVPARSRPGRLRGAVRRGDDRRELPAPVARPARCDFRGDRSVAHAARTTGSRGQNRAQRSALNRSAAAAHAAPSFWRQVRHTSAFTSASSGAASAASPSPRG